VKTTVEQLMEDYKNVYVTASKSGKLNSKLFKSYLDIALKKYVEGNKCLLILDSWGGQTKFNLMRNLLMRKANICAN
jgi:mannose/fructose-specific phosphotransferase system component IIA